MPIVILIFLISFSLKAEVCVDYFNSNFNKPNHQVYVSSLIENVQSEAYLQNLNDIQIQEFRPQDAHYWKEFFASLPFSSLETFNQIISQRLNKKLEGNEFEAWIQNLNLKGPIYLAVKFRNKITNQVKMIIPMRNEILNSDWVYEDPRTLDFAEYTKWVSKGFILFSAEKIIHDLLGHYWSFQANPSYAESILSVYKHQANLTRQELKAQIPIQEIIYEFLSIPNISNYQYIEEVFGELSSSIQKPQDILNGYQSYHLMLPKIKKFLNLKSLLVLNLGGATLERDFIKNYAEQGFSLGTREKYALNYPDFFPYVNPFKNISIGMSKVSLEYLLFELESFITTIEFYEVDKDLNKREVPELSREEVELLKEVVLKRFALIEIIFRNAVFLNLTLERFILSLSGLENQNIAKEFLKSFLPKRLLQEFKF